MAAKSSSSDPSTEDHEVLAQSDVGGVAAQEDYISPIVGHGEPNGEHGHFHVPGPLAILTNHHLGPLSRRRSSGRRSSTNRRRSSIVYDQHGPRRQWWKFKLRDWDDEDEEDWWFASTGVPLLAATIGPLANVLSIAALVTSWRMCLIPDVGQGLPARQCLWNETTIATSNYTYTLTPELYGQDFADPKWCYWCNVASLIFGFVGNFFLLCNFTGRIRYIIALPVTILCWYIATGILIGITVGMDVWDPPHMPEQTYTQGFWYAVIAACMYMICAMLLMLNMLGYFLGHYPQHFNLTDSQKTLILQTMLFFVWLAGGAAVFYRVEDLYGNGTEAWTYVNALYFCDVTILTVGFGDLYPTSNVGRGLVFPFSVGGIIMLGLMVSSITKFATELGSEKIIRRHIENSRARTIGRTVTSSMELDRGHAKLDGPRPDLSRPLRSVDQANGRPEISAPFDPKHRSTTIGFTDDSDNIKVGLRRTGTVRNLQRVASWAIRPPPLRTTRKPKLLLLREEKDRFDAMRRIQSNTSKFKNWYALFLSVMAFGTLWCVGAVVFWRCEVNTQGMTYFQALYFCYVSLLTIGYGDLAPKSNAGRPFFVFWSLIAVPTMTILVSDLGETVINKFKEGTFKLADFTVLPQKGAWKDFLTRHPWLLDWIQQRKEHRDARKRLEEGFQIGPEPDPPQEPPTLDELAKEEPSDLELAKKLANVIRRTAMDARDDPKKRYTYEEWVEFTQLIRFTAKSHEERQFEDEEEGMIEWDWIGEDSPMMAKGSEAQFVLERLCESMHRYVKRVAHALTDDGMLRKPSLPREEDGSFRAKHGESREAAGGTATDASKSSPVIDHDRSEDDIGPLGEKSDS